MRRENRDREGECYQVNSKVKAVYSNKEAKPLSFSVSYGTVEEKEFYTICLQTYHFKNSKEYLGISNEELLVSGKSKVVTASAQEVLEEFLRNNQNIGRKVEGRLTYINF